jgi:phenylacetate-CoA ligase
MPGRAAARMPEPLATRLVEGAYHALSRITPYTAWSQFQALQRNQWLSRDEVDAVRWRKMQALLNYAWREIPFYRHLWQGAGVDPSRFRGIQDVVELPIATRAAILQGQEDDAFLLSRRHDFQMTHSSGTTGPCVYLPYTRDDLQLKYAAYLREFYATDWRLGVRSAALHYFGHPEFGGRYTGTPDRDNFTLIRTLAFRLAHRRILLPPYHARESGDESAAAGWYAALRRYQPFLLESMDFNLVTLHHYIRDHGLPPLRIPRTIVLATLAPGLRQALEQAFQTEIFDRYGPHEMEGVAYACHEHRGMHMAIDCVHTEFLGRDDHPVAAGDYGRLVLTDLDSRVMPLIRYEIGDTGRSLDTPCPCGRRFPLMDEIACRTRDLFETPDGRVPPSALVAYLQEHPAVKLFQLVQAADSSIDARIVARSDAWQADTGPAIEQALAGMLPGGAVAVRATRVETVALEHNGKFCYAIRAR